MGTRSLTAEQKTPVSTSVGAGVFHRVRGWGDDQQVSDWHPIFLTSEPAPGVWEMKTPNDEIPFGRVELRRTEAGSRFKVAYKGEVVGWSTTLQMSCEKLWVLYLEEGSRARKGPPNGGYPPRIAGPSNSGGISMRGIGIE